jgi:hypothetical protein
MAGIITVILILVFSILITRVASIALTHTGLSRESARFQARSAFTGVGFTTSESEKVVNHPVRRRILLLLKRYSNVDVNDYASLLQLSGEFRISEQNIECDHWLCKMKLKNTKLRDEGLNILAISRKDGTFIGNPNGETLIKEDDSLIIYGRATALNKLERRLKGDKGNREHKQMIRQQEKVLNKERKLEEKQ